MPETYKSIGTILGNTGSTTIYSGISGTAIVNSVVFSNINVSFGTTVTLNIVKGLTSYSLLTAGDVPNKCSLQALDAPIVLDNSNTLTAIPGNTGFLHVLVSVLEIT
jgi:hypothetical protein